MRFLGGAREGYGGYRQVHGGARGGYRNSSRRGTLGGLHHNFTLSRHARPSSTSSPLPSSSTQLRSVFCVSPRWKMVYPLPKRLEALHLLVISSPCRPLSRSLLSNAADLRTAERFVSGACIQAMTWETIDINSHVEDAQVLVISLSIALSVHHPRACPSFVKVAPNTKKHSFTKDKPLKPLLHVHVHPSSSSLIQSKDDLKRMIISKVLSGNASVKSLHDFLPQHLKTDQCEHITPYGDDFILTLFSAKAIAFIVKKSPISLQTNLGQCSLKLSHWTPQFGSHAIAAGNYNWIRMSNLPLHCWNWNSIVEVLRPIGDLIFVQKKEDVLNI